MAPAELRALLADLPWDSYSAADLIEVATIARELGGTVQAVRTERRREAMRQRVEDLQHRQPAAATEPTRDQVFPAGTRFE